MREVFFAGDIMKNNGPSNVNKELFRFLKDDFMFVQSNNKWLFYLLFVYYTLRCKIIVFSGLLKIDFICLPLAKILKKNIVYIMHGCVQYEQGEIIKKDDSGIRLENRLFKDADQILCVSKPFAEWFKNYKNEYSCKVDVLQNGIPWDTYEYLENNNCSEKSYRSKKIILVGGGRLIKNNINVVKAVQQINETSREKWTIDLYGYYRNDDDSERLLNYDFVDFRGMVSHDELMGEFANATLFVQNSILESFGLTSIEAIMNKCNLLISCYVGCSAVMELEENDIIMDPHNVDEIARKITGFEQTNNFDRLVKSINRENTSCEFSANRLKKIVEKISLGGMMDEDTEN